MNRDRVDLSPAESAYVQAHERYINHILSCPQCYAPTRRYCAAGLALQIDNEARYLMTLDLHARRYILARKEAAEAGSSEGIKARLMAIHHETKTEKELSDE